MSRLFFIRHGQASFGKEKYDELSELGLRQSALLAHYFNMIGIRFDAIYTGTLSRHLETAEALLPLLQRKGASHPFKSLEGLDEYPTEMIFRAMAPDALDRDPSLSDDIARLMTDRRSFQRVFEAVMSLWASGANDIPGLITWKEFTDRVGGAIHEIMKADGKGKTVAICTSGGAISAAVGRVLDLSPDTTMRVAEQLVNSSVCRFKCTTTRIMMATFNEYPHLEREGDDALITYR